MTSADLESKKRWLVASGCSIGLAIGFGPIFIYCFGLFQRPMLLEFGWTRAEFSLGFSLATLVAALCNTFVGILIDKGYGRTVIIIGTIVLPITLLGFSTIRTYSAFIVMALCMGLAGGSTSYPAYMPILPPWFRTRLGLALSIAAAGVGYGTAILSPLISHFIVTLGWRHAMQTLATLLVIIGLGNTFLLIDTNAPKHLQGTESRGVGKADDAVDLRQACRSPVFWLLTTAFALIPVVSIGINFHFAVLLTDRGYSAGEAAAVVATGGIAILIARVSTGALLDYLSAITVGVVLFAGQAIGVLLLIMGSGGVTPFIAASLLGLASGGEGDLMPYILSRRFGQKAYGKLYGFSFAFYNLGTLIGPLLMGWGFVRFGDYQRALITFMPLSICAALFVALSARFTVRHGAMHLTSQRAG